MSSARWLADAYKAKRIRVTRISIECQKEKLEQRQNA
ncbi:hypothetical protein I9X38_18600 [Bacillus mojavensis]|nr:hypothetical protein I9X38_18600 [Bacillus mojavensis]